MGQYEVVISWSEEDEALSPRYRNCLAVPVMGESRAAALASCREAIDLWVETATEFRRAIPEPDHG